MIYPNDKREPFYHLNNSDHCNIPSFNNTDSILFLGLLITNLLPSNLKRIDDLVNFKTTIYKFES